MRYQQIAIKDIIIDNRGRKDMGDIRPLAESIKTIGLLHAPVVNSRFELVVGERRIRACELNGETHIECKIMEEMDDPVALLVAESDENDDRFRKPLTPSEAWAMGKRIEEAIQDQVRRSGKSRHQQAIDRRKKGERKKSDEEEPRSHRESRHIVAKSLGYSHNTMSKIDKVMEAAEQEPEKFKTVVEEMDRTGNVNGALKRVEKAQKEIALQSEVNLDAIGIEIPSHLLNAFGNRLIRDALDEIQAAIDRLNSAYRCGISTAVWNQWIRTDDDRENDPRQRTRHLGIISLTDRIRNLLRALSSRFVSAIPHVVHQKCNGNGCDDCRNTGFLPWKKHQQEEQQHNRSRKQIENTPQ